jgi:hypothetical protein
LFLIEIFTKHHRVAAIELVRMKKLIYPVLIGIAFTVDPVSGSDMYVHTAPVLAQPNGSAATELIPVRIREILDKVRSPSTESSKAAAANVQTRDVAPQPTQLAALGSDHYGAARRSREERAYVLESEARSDTADWTLLPAALLLIGFIIRRRTAVR